MLTLITGGSRSGKTRYALATAGELQPRTYIATAELRDDEMRERARRHQAERGDQWRTVEEPFEIVGHLHESRGIIVVDCLTVWLSNWMLRDELQVDRQIERLCLALGAARCHVIAITNEVGLSIVPENPLARRFRDWSGLMNQRVATAAGAVYLMVCGIPVRVK
jgi:adenosylcobinamide kinase / adenosylcobinamide-phosphate guanylyltransferase